MDNSPQLPNIAQNPPQISTIGQRYPMEIETIIRALLKSSPLDVSSPGQPMQIPQNMLTVPPPR